PGIQSIAFFTLLSSPYPNTSRVRIMLPVRQGSSQRVAFFPGCPLTQRFTPLGLGHVKAPLSNWWRSRNCSQARLTPSSGVNPISPRSIKGQTVDVHLGV